MCSNLVRMKKSALNSECALIGPLLCAMISHAERVVNTGSRDLNIDNQV